MPLAVGCPIRSTTIVCVDLPAYTGRITTNNDYIYLSSRTISRLTNAKIRSIYRDVSTICIILLKINEKTTVHCRHCLPIWVTPSPERSESGHIIRNSGSYTGVPRGSVCLRQAFGVRSSFGSAGSRPSAPGSSSGRACVSNCGSAWL